MTTYTTGALLLNYVTSPPQMIYTTASYIIAGNTQGRFRLTPDPVGQFVRTLERLNDALANLTTERDQ